MFNFDFVSCRYSTVQRFDENFNYLSFSQRMTNGSISFGGHCDDHKNSSVFDHAFNGMPEVRIAHFKPVRFHHQIAHNGFLYQHVHDEKAVPDCQTKEK
jgi:hypothetical protein